MDKVVAFLEKYAQYLALGLAVAFLGYVAYASFLSNPALDIKVGSEVKAPGEVDAAIMANDAERLKNAAAKPASEEVKALFITPEFDKFFKTGMGPDRPNVQIVTRPISPGIPREQGPVVPGERSVLVMSGPPKPPAPDNVGPTSGQSFVKAPDPLPPLALNNPNPPAQPQPAPVQPGQQVAGMDINWITLEFKIDLKKVAAAWTAVFNDPKTGQRIFPDASAKTSILWVEVQREELTGPNQWGNPVTLKPLPLSDVSQVAETVWNKFKDPDDEEAFRLWAEKRQLDIVEPSFFQTLSGDNWKSVSTTPQVDPAAGVAAAPVVATPFDPANPPKDRELTSDEKRQVYVYNQQQKKEKEKTAMQEAKARAAAAEAARKAKSTSPTPPVSPTGPGKRGAYAPIPLAADSEFGGRGAAPARPAPGAPGAPLRPGERGPVRTIPGSARPGPEITRPVAPVPGANNSPALLPTTFQPNPILTGPFDPMEVVNPNPQAPVAQGQPTDITVWAHDATAQPGKVYRYRMRYYLKNPLHLTHGFTKNPQDGKTFALPSEFSPWMTATAPQNVHFFFAKKKANPRNLAVVDNVDVDVFKRDKGVWTKQTFTVVPGDSVGQMANGVDFATGSTVVDLRLDTRNDVRILIANETGDVETRTLTADLNDDFYKELLQKVNTPVGPNAAANP